MLINLSKDDSVRNDLLIIAENTLQTVADPEKRNFGISIELEKLIAELTTLTAMK